MQGVDEDLLESAFSAVAHALRPRLRNIIAQQITWPTPDKVTDVAFVLRTRAASKADLDRIGPWWEASGYELTDALMDLRGIDRSLASHLIGAAVQAQVTAGQDLVSDYVLRLAEAAAVWLDGANRTPSVTA